MRMLEEVGVIDEETVGRDKTSQKSKQAESEVDVAKEAKDKAVDNPNDSNQLGKVAHIDNLFIAVPRIIKRMSRILLLKKLRMVILALCLRGPPANIIIFIFLLEYAWF